MSRYRQAFDVLAGLAALLALCDFPLLAAVHLTAAALIARYALTRVRRRHY